MPTFPNVPDVPGVPPVPRAPGGDASVPGGGIGNFIIGQSAIGGDTGGVESVTVSADKNSPQWGLFKDGSSVLEADNVVAFEYKREWAVSDYPLEGGAFETYNKVQFPFDVRLRFSTGGSVEKREAFLKSIEAIDGSLDLFDAVIPEKVYSSVNIQHVDYRRSSDRGVGLIVVDIYALEVRESATETFANAQTSPASATSTKSPTAQAKKDGGTKQPQPISKSDQKELDIARGMALAS